jgi:hypothetical protein
MRLHAFLTNIAGNILAASAALRARGRLSVCIVCMQAVLVALSSAQEAPATYAVDGVVENSVTQQPIARVLVEGRSDAVFTDGEGRFELHLPPGVTPITLRRPGYGNGQFSAREMQHAVVVGPNMPQLTFSISPSAGITGHVMLSTGDDADGLRFTLYQKRIMDGHAHWMQAGSAATGSEGVLRFLSLEAPASYVLCSAPSPDRLVGAARRAPVSGYAPTCYPGGSDFASAIAAPFALSPGQQAQIEISLSRQMFYPVYLSVANTAQNAFIQVFDRSGHPTESMTRRNGPNGESVLDLPNGSYYAEVRQGGNPQLYARLDFTVAAAPLYGLTLVPVPEQPISVEIRREFTATSAAGGGVVNNGNGNRDVHLDLNLFPVDKTSAGQISASLRPVAGSSDADAYEIDPVPTGTYRVQTSAMDQYYASAITSGGTDLLREPLVIGPGNGVPPIEITVRNDIGRIECWSKTSPAAVQAGSPGEVDIALTFVYAIRQSPGTQRIYQSVAQFRGNQSIPLFLPPGRYSVVAFKQPHDIDLDDAEELSRLAKEAQTVTIEAGASAQVEVDPIPTAAREASE